MPTIIERGESTLMQKKKWHVLIVDDELRIGTLINNIATMIRHIMRAVSTILNVLDFVSMIKPLFK